MSSLNPSFSAVAISAARIMEEDTKKSSPRPMPPLSYDTIPSSSNLKISFKDSSSTYKKSRIPHNLLFSSHKGRKPQKGREIIPSHLRPCVPAKERLYFWRTPYGENHLHDLVKELPVPLASATCLAIRTALKPETASTYAAGVLRFTQFCDRWHIPECERMPASYALLSAFIATNVGKEAGKTIKTWLSGIHAWHSINHAPWYGDDKWVHMCRSVANREGTSHEKAPRPPASIEHLLALYRVLDLSIPFHAAVWAAALVAFFACRRLGEITLRTLSGFDAKYNVQRSSNPILKSHPNNSKSISFHIPWSKVTKERGADIVVTARNDRLCPVAALLRHFLVNHNLPPDAPLFAYETGGGTWRPLIKHEFLGFVNKIWSDVNLHYIYGHSLRIGGAVALLLAGVPPEIVAATGGWTSLSFLLYWRRLEDILPMSTSRAYHKANIERLACIFEQFRVRHNIPKRFIDTFVL